MDYYQKYQKYKFKYLNLLNQSGGMTPEEVKQKAMQEIFKYMEKRGLEGMEQTEYNNLLKEKINEISMQQHKPLEHMLEKGINELREQRQPNGAPQGAPPGAHPGAPPRAYGPPGAPPGAYGPQHGAYGPQHGAPPGPQQMQQQRQQQMQQQQRPLDLKTDLFNGLQHLKRTITVMEQKLTNGNL